jgi:hypothetical protein
MAKLSDFIETGTKTSGKSPSRPMQYNQHTYQVKRSNYVRAMRRMIGIDPDPSDVLGEFVASSIAKSLSSTIYKDVPETMEMSPEVILIEDSENSEIRIGSKYLNSGSQTIQGATLDQVLRGTGKGKDTDKHAIIVCSGGKREEDEERRILEFGNGITTSAFQGSDGSYPEIKLEKKQLYRAIKLSMLLGDHDINPGNIFVNYDQSTGKTQICRIDYGHAFNDLIKSWGRGSHEPDKRESVGFVLDSINRTTINGGQSKLIRDFRGVIPDLEFAEVLREASDDLYSKIDAAAEKAIGELSALESTEDKTIKSRLESGLKTLIKRCGGKVSPANPIHTSVRSAADFVKENAEEMKSVANLIEIQHLVSEIAKSGDKKANEAKLDRIKEIFNNDKKYLRKKGSDDKIEWVREEGESKPKICSLKELIESAKAREARVSISPHVQPPISKVKASFLSLRNILKSHASKAPIAATGPSSRVKSGGRTGQSI